MGCIELSIVMIKVMIGNDKIGLFCGYSRNFCEKLIENDGEIVILEKNSD